MFERLSHEICGTRPTENSQVSKSQNSLNCSLTNGDCVPIFMFILRPIRSATLSRYTVVRALLFFETGNQFIMNLLGVMDKSLIEGIELDLEYLN